VLALAEAATVASAAAGWQPPAPPSDRVELDHLAATRVAGGVAEAILSTVVIGRLAFTVRTEGERGRPGRVERLGWTGRSPNGI